METVLKEAGSCGRFQVYHVIFTQIPRFVTVWGVMMMMFGGYDPGWRCAVDKMSSINGSDRDGILNKTYLLNISTIDTGWLGNIKSDDSETSPTSFTRNLSTSFEHDFYGSCDMMTSCQGESIEFNPASNTIVTEFQLICERGWIVKVMLTMLSLGLLVGALLGGQIGEKFGRKVSLYSGAVILCIFSGVAIFSFHWIMYAACLFMMGLGSNCIQSTSVIFSMEFLNSKWRSLFGSIPTWNLSLCIFTFSISVMKSWVQVHIVTCTLSLIACVGYFILPESVRWLAVHGFQKEAEKVITRVARFNRKPPPSHDVLEMLQGECCCESGQRTHTYLDLFKTKKLRVLTLKFVLICILLFSTYYALGFGIQTLPGNFYVNLIASSACEIVIAVSTGFLGNKIGRRWTGFVLGFVGALSCAGIVVVLYTAKGVVQSTIIKTFSFIAKGTSMGISINASTSMAEHFPTVVRNVVAGLLRAMAGLGGLFAPFLIPSPSVESFAICFSIMCICYAVTVVLFLSLSETNKLCLIDTIDKSSKPRATENECDM